MCYSLRGICVQSEHWDGVAVSDHDKHEWLEMTKSVWTTCEVFFCTSVAKASMRYSSLCLFRVCWWCAIDIEIAQNPQMLTNVFVCVQIVCHFFSTWIVSWSLFFILHHTQQTNMLQYDFTHINLSSTHNYHIVHPKPTAEMLIKWEGCTWWFQTSWISNEKTRNSTE